MYWISRVLRTVIKLILFSALLNLILFVFCPNLALWLISRPFYCINFTKLTWQIIKNPQSEKALYYRGIYRIEYGSKKGAISDFTQAIKVRSKKPKLKKIAAPYYKRGRAYERLGDVKKAISDYSIAAEIYKQYGKISDAEFILQKRQNLIERECKSINTIEC